MNLADTFDRLHAKLGIPKPNFTPENMHSSLKDGVAPYVIMAILGGASAEDIERKLGLNRTQVETIVREAIRHRIITREDADRLMPHKFAKSEGVYEKIEHPPTPVAKTEHVPGPNADQMFQLPKTEHIGAAVHPDHAGANHPLSEFPHTQTTESIGVNPEEPSGWNAIPSEVGIGGLVGAGAGLAYALHKGWKKLRSYFRGGPTKSDKRTQAVNTEASAAGQKFIDRSKQEHETGESPGGTPTASIGNESMRKPEVKTDVRELGDGIAHRATDDRGSGPSKRLDLSILESSVLKNVLGSPAFGVPVLDRKIGDQALMAHINAGVKYAKDHADERRPEVAEYFRAINDLEKSKSSDDLYKGRERLTAAAKGLMAKVREENPHLDNYKKKSEIDNAPFAGEVDNEVDLPEPVARQEERKPEFDPKEEETDVLPGLKPSHFRERQQLWNDLHTRKKKPMKSVEEIARVFNVKKQRAVAIARAVDKRLMEAGRRKAAVAPPMPDVFARKGHEGMVVPLIKKMHSEGKGREDIRDALVNHLGLSEKQANSRVNLMLGILGGRLKSLTQPVKKVPRTRKEKPDQKSMAKMLANAILNQNRYAADKFAKMKAPAGGMISGNQFYEGGKMLPLEASGQLPPNGIPPQPQKQGTKRSAFARKLADLINHRMCKKKC